MCGRTAIMKTRFVLIETSHAGNVGAVARAMKVMGFDDLVLVRPRWNDVLTRDEAVERASGADDVLRRARVVEHLSEALEGMDYVCATAMTPRDFGPTTVAPRGHFEAMLKAPDLRPSGVAFLMGSERYGMRNQDVYASHVCLSIPTNPDYGSLNLAAAVQLLAYEWRQALGGYGVTERIAAPIAADGEAVYGMLQHLEKALVHLGYLDPAAPKKLMPRLHQMFNRARVSAEEVHIWRGVSKAILQAAPPRHD